MSTTDSGNSFGYRISVYPDCFFFRSSVRRRLVCKSLFGDCKGIRVRTGKMLVTEGWTCRSRRERTAH